MRWWTAKGDRMENTLRLGEKTGFVLIATTRRLT
jgi:hypothetical protein